MYKAKKYKRNFINSTELYLTVNIFAMLFCYIVGAVVLNEAENREAMCKEFLSISSSTGTINKESFDKIINYLHDKNTTCSLEIYNEKTNIEDKFGDNYLSLNNDINLRKDDRIIINYKWGCLFEKSLASKVFLMNNK